MTRFRKKSVQTLIAAIITAILCLGFIRLAEAQSLNSTLGSPFLETLHHVSMTRNDDIAYVEVLRAFKNEGKRRDEMILGLNLPSNTSMTGISIYEEGWKPAILKHATQAKTQYYKTNPARKKNVHNLLAEGSWENCSIRVSPISPGETVLIRYNLAIEMEYEEGYSFRWKTSPKSSERFSAIQFQSAKTIWAKGVQRSAGEVFYLHANRCEENGLKANCQIREFDLPETKEERFRFSADRGGDLLGALTYTLRSPEGEMFAFRLDPSQPKIERELPSVSGQWIFSVAQNSNYFSFKEKERRFFVRNIQLKFDTTTLTTKDIQFTQSEHDFDRIYFSDTRENKGRMFFGSFKLDGRQFSKIDLALPKRLSELPKNATMIFLIDSSISQTQLGLKRQLALVNSITSHTDDEEIILIAYNRHAKQIPLAKAYTLEKILHNMEKNTSLGNGSDLGEAIELAARLSSTVDRKRPILIYAMTDLLLKSSQTLSTLEPKVHAFGKNVTFHLIEVPRDVDYETRIRRDDTIFLSEMTRPSGGVSVVANFEGDDIDMEALFKQSLYLVRPTILDHPTLSGFSTEKVYPEGAVISAAGWKTIRGRAEITGELWSRPFSMSSARSKDRELVTMRYFVNSESYENAKQAYIISNKSQMVSSHTSFIIDGAERIEEGFTGMSGLGLSGVGSVGCGGVFLGPTSVAKPGLRTKFNFKALAEACNAAHPGKKNTFRTIMETTNDEIVDVVEGKTAYDKCIVEGIWNTRLPVETKSAPYSLQFMGAYVRQ